MARTGWRFAWEPRFAMSLSISRAERTCDARWVRHEERYRQGRPPRGCAKQRLQKVQKAAAAQPLQQTTTRASSVATQRRVAQRPRLRHSPGWLPERGGQGWVCSPDHRGSTPVGSGAARRRCRRSAAALALPEAEASYDHRPAWRSTRPGPTCHARSSLTRGARPMSAYLRPRGACSKFRLSCRRVHARAHVQLLACAWRANFNAQRTPLIPESVRAPTQSHTMRQNTQE